MSLTLGCGTTKLPRVLRSGLPVRYDRPRTIAEAYECGGPSVGSTIPMDTVSGLS
jgi:hypothetical protein